LRGKRSLRQLEAESGILRGTLSRIENGRLLPDDSQVAALEELYGAEASTWYDSRTLLAIQADDGYEPA
jgi:transcriptional regulator with XRE-family HTH domain